MSWIKMIGFEEADEALKNIYRKVQGPDGNIDNILLIHSLRPHTLKGHMTLYKSVLHHYGNKLPKSYLESIGVYVSNLNSCQYCVDHHLEGIKRLVGKDESSKIWEAIKREHFSGSFSPKEIAGFKYARILTKSMSAINEENITALRTDGFDDGEILELNQVISYFNYVNRTVLGLGVDTKGDVLGLSPNESEDPENWNHN